MALTANTVRTSKDVFSGPKSFKVAAAVHIYQGAIVGLHPILRYLKPYETPDIFVGVAYEECDNSSGAAAAKECLVYTSGDFIMPLTSVADADVGKAVYAIDDNSLSLFGHPDGFMGRIVGKSATNECIVQLKMPNERPAMDGSDGCLEFVWDGNATSFANLVTATGEIGVKGFRIDAIGAGITAGAGVLPGGDADGTKLLLDNDNEAQNVTIQTPECLLASKGMSFSLTGRLKTAGGAATDDVDFGLMTAASNLITDAIRANMDVTTAGIRTVKFHLDANANDIFAGADDDTTVVSATDTTIDNSLTVNKTFDIIIRASGVAELYIEKARVLSGTVFSIGTSIATYFAGIFNLEKSTGTGVPECRIKNIRVAGSFGS